MGIPPIFPDQHAGASDQASLLPPTKRPSLSSLASEHLKKIERSPPPTPAGTLIRVGQEILDNSPPEEHQVWKQAFDSWKASLNRPEATEEDFSIYLLKNKGIYLPQILLKFASIIYLGDRPSRQLSDGLSITVALSTPKAGRVKVVTLFPTWELLGQGSEATVYKFFSSSSKTQEGITSTKPIKVVAYRESIYGQSNSTLQHIGEFFKQLSSLPPGVKLDNGRWPVGIQKPLKSISKRESYGRLMGGSVYDWLITPPTPRLKPRINVLDQLICGLGAITASHADYLDLKTENILRDTKHRSTVISDWGGVKLMTPLDSTATQQKLFEAVDTYLSSPSPPLTHTPIYNLRSEINLINKHREHCARDLKLFIDAVGKDEPGELEANQLRKTWHEYILLIEKIQMFQLGICTLEILDRTGDVEQLLQNALEEITSPNTPAYHKEPFSEDFIKELVKDLRYSRATSSKISAFLSRSVGASFESRAMYQELLPLFNEMIESLEKEKHL